MTDGVGSVGVKIVPDARGWDAEVEAAIGRTKVRIQVALDEAQAKAKVDEVARDRKTKIKAEADTNEAKVKIDDVARDRRTTITVRADTADAGAKIDRVARDRKAKVKVEADTSGLGWMATAALGLGPGLIPLGAGALAAGAIGAPLLAGGTGLGLFAGAAKNQVAATNQINKQLQSYAKQAQNATTTAAQTKALKEYAAEYAKLNSSQLAFLRGEQQLSGAWHKLTSGTDVFGPLTQGMGILTTVLPKLKPLLDTTDKALTDILGNVDHYVKSGSFDHLVKQIDTLAGPGLTLGAQTLGNFAKGVSELGVAVGPLGLQGLQGLDHLMARFAAWGNGSASEQQFISYLGTEGPKALHTLGDLAIAITHITEAAAPWGGVVLTTLDDLLQILDKIPPNALTPVVAGISGVNLGLKAMKALGGLQEVGNGIALIGAMSDRAGSTSLANFGNGLSNASKRLSESKVNMGALSAGLAGLVVSSTSADVAITTLGDTASGALIGFGVGGPIGAAVGGLAGLLTGGLISSLHHSNAAFDSAKQAAANYGTTLDQLTGKITDATRAQAIENLGAGNIRTAASIGIGPSMLADAALGNAGDAKTIARAVEKAFSAAKANGDSVDTLIKLANAYGTLISAIGGSNAGLADQITLLKTEKELHWASVKAANGYAAALHALPSKIQTRLEALDVAPTLAQVINLAAHYNATPKSVQTYLRALGINESIAQIKALIAQADKVDRNHTIRVNADTSAAIAAFESLSGTWRSIFGALGMTETVTNPKTHKSATAVARVPMIGKLLAEGGRITGPGTGTSDSIWARVSNGEFVMNAKATSAYLPLLEAMNARRFATGGPVTPGQLAASLPSITSKVKKSRRVAGVKPLTAQQLAAAQYAFTLSESMSVASIDRAFHNFSAKLEAHGEHVVGTFDRLRRAAERNVETYASTSRQLQALQANVSSIQSAAANSFNHNVFGGTYAELVTQLSADKNDAIAMKNAINLAKKHGLSGDFGAQLAASGNLGLAQSLAGMTKAQISSVQALYGARGKADTALGNTAASFYTAEISQMNALLKANAAALKTFNAEARQIGNRVEAGAAAGMRHQSTQIANRTRTR